VLPLEAHIWHTTSRRALGRHQNHAIAEKACGATCQPGFEATSLCPLHDGAGATQCGVVWCGGAVHCGCTQDRRSRLCVLPAFHGRRLCWQACWCTTPAVVTEIALSPLYTVLSDARSSRTHLCTLLCTLLCSSPAQCCVVCT
jgi:hypothetical protein